LDALYYSWCFTLRNNCNPELWDKLTSELNKLDLTQVNLEMKKCLYQIILSRNIELEAFKLNVSRFAGYFNEFDERGIDDHMSTDPQFKKMIGVILKRECYIMEPNQKASLYICDYTNEPGHAVLILGYGTFVADTHKEHGQILLMKRLLKKMDYTTHLIDKKSYESFRKSDEKLDYIRKAMKGIPQDEEALDKQKVDISY